MDLARGPSAEYLLSCAGPSRAPSPTFRCPPPQEHDHSNSDSDAAIDDATEEKAQHRAHTNRRSSPKHPPPPPPHRTAPLSPYLAPSSSFPAPPRDVRRRRRGRPRRPSSWTTSRPTRMKMIPTRYRSRTFRSRQRRQRCTFTCMSPAPRQRCALTCVYPAPLRLAPLLKRP